MADLFGVAAGQQAAIQTQQSQELTSLAMAEGAGRIRAQQLANTEASLTLQRQEMLNKLMQQSASKMGAGGINSDSIVGQMNEMAELALQSGLPEQAAEYATKASTIEKNTSTIASNKAKVDADHAKLIGNLLEGVHDQQSWDQANAAYMLYTGQPSPVSKIPYSPQVVKRMQDAATTVYQKSQIQHNKAIEKIAASKTDESRKSLQERITHDRAMEQAARDRALEKAGSAKAPSANNLKAVTDLINKSYDLDPTDQAAARALARPIAERAEELIKTGMSQSQATEKAFQEAKRHNDFAGMPEHRGMPGESAATAMPLPDDRSKLKENQYYTVRGQPALYKGGKFIVDVQSSP